MTPHDPPGPTPDLLRQPARRSQVPSFIVMDVISAAARREAAGHRVIHMEVGQPGTPAPKVARDAVKRSIDTDKLGYTEGLGLPALRARIAEHYRETYGVRIASERVVVTTGSSAAFVLSFMALHDPGDRVLLPSPGYPCYRHILSALGVESVLAVTGPETRWMPTAAQITAAARSPGLASVLIASPGNPTGSMLSPERLAEIVATCREHRLWFISDEIYHGLTYTAPAHTALEFGDDVIVINSFSKYFSMTGWRIGWMIVPPGLVRILEKLATNLYISPPTVSQVAALAAFDGRDELDANRAVYAANREVLLEGLPRSRLRQHRAGRRRVLSIRRCVAPYRR